MTGLSVGNQLDHYRIDELIARSGMASIFRAIDLNDGKQVGIKLPHPEMECDPMLFDRFKREIEIGVKLNHPGVMKVFDGEKRSRVYMVMEWVDGKLLRRMMGPQHKLPVDRAVYLTVQILHSLAYIHANGVVHRDLKPENIMVDADDHIKLIDFGIAGNEGSRRLTFAKLSNVMGTPDYISPEQVKGKRGDGRADLYAVGVMLYEMLTGKMPFEGPNQLAIMNERLLNNPVPPREVDPTITPELQEIIYRAMEREPAKRYPTAREFIHDLEHQNEVGVADREELRDWKVRKTGTLKKVLTYLGLILIPVVVFTLLLWVARKA
jgi:eukaryotic-like serine/threonine-protein kinase